MRAGQTLLVLLTSVRENLSLPPAPPMSTGIVPGVFALPHNNGRSTTDTTKVWMKITGPSSKIREKRLREVKEEGSGTSHY